MTDDIKISWNSDYLEGDLSVVDEDLESESGLETAVIISLFTDRRARDDDELPDPNNLDKRGWWGDLVSEVEGDQIGSRLWLLSRAKTTENVLVKAKEYAEESLRWLIEDGIAKKVEVEAERQNPGGNDRLALLVKIYQTSENVTALKFQTRWEAQIS